MDASRPLLAVSMGDPLGIGPEITARALARQDLLALARFRVHGSAAALRNAAERFGIPFHADGQNIAVIEHGGLHAALAAAPVPTAEGGRASMTFVEAAIADAQRPAADPARADAIVTAPIAKESWKLAGFSFPGHTELLAQRFASPRSAMLFVGPALRVILATVHVPLSAVPGLLTTARVLECIELGAQACIELGLPKPRIAVAGLNPHAGEAGQFGPEDATIIAPAVDAARQRGIACVGPLPGDTVFLSAVKGHADLVVAMYHDQGLIPVKLLDREKSVNVTTGLAWRGIPIVRTSPAHGTAFDIAGRGVASDESMACAIALAARLATSRRP